MNTNCGAIIEGMGVEEEVGSSGYRWDDGDDSWGAMVSRYG